MKKYLFLFLCTILFSFTAKAQTNNNEQKFNNVFVSIPARIVILEGDTCSVALRTKNDNSKYIDVNIEDETLKITSNYLDLLYNDNIKIIITTPTLPAIETGKLFDLIDITKKNKNINDNLFA